MASSSVEDMVEGEGDRDSRSLEGREGSEVVVSVAGGCDNGAMEGHHRTPMSDTKFTLMLV